MKVSEVENVRELKKQFHLISYSAGSSFIEISPSPSENCAAISVIIGPNGSGKSRIISEIVDEFSLIEEIKNETVNQTKLTHHKSKFPNSEIKYLMNGKFCQINRKGNDLTCLVDKKVVSQNNMPFPHRAFAVAHLPVDRFRFAKKDTHTFYHYLGLRQSTNLTTTGALELKVLYSTLDAYARGRINNMDPWFVILGLGGPSSIKLNISNLEILQAKNQSEFSEIAKYIYQRRMGRGRSSPEFDIIFHESIAKSYNLFNIIRKHFDESSGERYVRMSVSQIMDLFGPIEFREGVDAARRVRLIGEAEIYYKKNSEEVKFSQLSSGEQQILGTITQLISEVEDNSIIAIDEPEVSLHPSWQMRYIPTLMETFKKFPSTHILIATHSHFLVSDVHPDRASLIVSSSDAGKRFSQFDGDVYGRSPENILYRAFGIAASGNFYVERDLTKALRMVTGQDPMNIAELSNISERLRKAIGDDNEPLRLILEKIQKRLDGEVR